MRKRTILWLSVVAIVFVVIGLVVFLPAVFAAAQSCTQAQIRDNTCTPKVTTGQGAAIAAGILLFIVAGILSTIAWIGALIRSAKMQSWGWFVVILLFHGLAALIYGIAGPPDRPVMGAYPPPGYPPQYPPGYPQQYPQQ